MGCFIVGALRTSSGPTGNARKGLIDEVRLSGRALDVDEIEATFAAESP